MEPEKAMKGLINHFNRVFFEDDDTETLTWSRWFFPVINQTDGLKEIDHYLQQNIRFLRPVGQEEAPVLQQAQRRFGIHPVLVASEGNGPNGIRHMTRFPFCFLVSHEGV